MKKTFSWIIAVWSLVLLFLALEITGLLPPYSGSHYWFTLPFIANVAVTFVLGLIAAMREKSRSNYYLAPALFLFVPVTWYFALARWPGGDDGPGMGWYFSLGLGMLIAFLIGAVNLAVLYRKGKREGTT